MRILLFLIWLWQFVGPVHAGEPSWVRSKTAIDAAGSLEPLPELPDDWVFVPGVLAHVHAKRTDRATALRISRHASRKIPEIAESLGVPAGAEINIYVTPNKDSFRELQPREPPAWADGTAWAHRGLIFLRSPRIRPGTASPLEQVLEHELVHVLLGRAFGDRPVPRWLQEGMAQVLAREYTSELTDQLAAGLLGSGLLSLDTLTTSFPADPIRARLAYAQSADLVAYIKNTHGPQALRILVREMTTGSQFPAAIRAATGRDMAEVDQAWRTRLSSSPLWIKPLTSDAMWWGLGALLIPIGWWTVRKRNRKKLARWEREEILQDALYRAIERSYLGDEPPADDVSKQPGPRWSHPEDPWVH